MENATKALLIAAAILIAILIISLSLIVYQMASKTISGVNLTKAEVEQFNSTFQQYEGTNVSGSNVNAMLRTVLNNNVTETEANRKVEVELQEQSKTYKLATDAKNLSTIQAESSSRYTVKCILGGTGGLVNKITVKNNNIVTEE